MIGLGCSVKSCTF